MQLLEPPASERAWYALGAAVLAMLGLLLAGRLAQRLRTAAAVLVAVAVAPLALLGGGVADELLRPDRWGELLAGIGRGISSLPGARVPYRGLDEWTRIVLGAGGTMHRRARRADSRSGRARAALGAATSRSCS